jgi:hypothetical protein
VARLSIEVEHPAGADITDWRRYFLRLLPDGTP